MVERSPVQSRLKGRGFESRQKRRVIFSPGSSFCADSYFGIRSTPVILPKVQVAGYS